MQKLLLYLIPFLSIGLYNSCSHNLHSQEVQDLNKMYYRFVHNTLDTVITVELRDSLITLIIQTPNTTSVKSKEHKYRGQITNNRTYIDISEYDDYGYPLNYVKGINTNSSKVKMRGSALPREKRSIKQKLSILHNDSHPDHSIYEKPKILQYNSFKDFISLFFKNYQLTQTK